MTKQQYEATIERLASLAIDSNGQENGVGHVVSIDWDGALESAMQLCTDELSVKTWAFSQSLNVLAHTTNRDAYLVSYDQEACRPMHELDAAEIIHCLALAALQADVIEELDRTRDEDWQDTREPDSNFTESRHA